MEATSVWRPLLGDWMKILPPSMSAGLKLRTSLTLIPPRAIRSSMRRFLRFWVLKIISSMVSFSTIFQGTGLRSLKTFRSMGEAQGFWNLSLPEFMTKAKKARRRENLSLFVDCLAPSAKWPKKERISSEVREPVPLSPNWVENPFRTYS